MLYNSEDHSCKIEINVLVEVATMGFAVNICVEPSWFIHAEQIDFILNRNISKTSLTLHVVFTDFGLPLLIIFFRENLNSEKSK